MWVQVRAMAELGKFKHMQGEDHINHPLRTGPR